MRKGRIRNNDIKSFQFAVFFMFRIIECISIGNIRIVNAMKEHVHFENKIKIEENYLNKIKCLKQGLMADLLTGKKEVKLSEEMMSEKELIAR